MYRVNDGLLPNGAKAKFTANVEAIRLLKSLTETGRKATEEEKTILSCYVGWGGLSQAFDPANNAWKKEYSILKVLLTENEYENARASVNSAFYTPYTVASAITAALKTFGVCEGKNILEPCCGIGNFFGCMPKGMENANLYGVELDSISGMIAQAIYPEVNIQIKGFETTNFSDGFFDAVVGNVPFGDFGVYDPKYKRRNYKIHDYFIMKSVDLVRPGGIVAVITSKGTMDKKDSAFRKELSKKANLLGAIRLPANTFKANAGTEVTTDILVFQKKQSADNNTPVWVKVGETEDQIPVNQYYVENPDMMFGKMVYDNGMFGPDSKYTACVNTKKGFDLEKELKDAFGKMVPEDVTSYEQECEENVDTIQADPNVKNFTYAIRDGKVYHRQFSVMVEKKVDEKKLERIKAMDQLRFTMKQILEAQTQWCEDSALDMARMQLNDEYDSFVKKFGTITSRANRLAFRDDAEYPLLCSLEVVDEEDNVTKADIFTKRTTRPWREVVNVSSAMDALQASINTHGCVNVNYMLSLYNVSENQLFKELEGVVFIDPVTDTLVTAEEYLSGDVRQKLDEARFAEDIDPCFKVNVEALEKVQPQDLEASDIDVRLGATWIDERDIESFMYDLFSTPYYCKRDYSKYSGIIVSYNRITNEWFIENKGRDSWSVSVTQMYGTARITAYEILEDTLNLRSVVVRDQVENPDGSVRSVINKNETMVAREKQELIKQKFREWIFEDVDRRTKYVDYYNKTFNCTRLRSFDGSHLDFPGMNPDIVLMKHQRDAIARAISGNTLLAHVVGAGKSFEMIAAIMKSRQVGTANKAMLIVPKQLLLQMASEFLRLYPGANLLVATDRDFEKSRRQQFIARIATGDYDCVIMAQSQFEKIPVSPERRIAAIKEQLEEVEKAIDSLRGEPGKRHTVKQMESLRRKLNKQFLEMTSTERKDDIGIYFESLGVDMLVVDESHNYKNLAIFSKINNVAGIATAGSQRAFDMLMKCRYINEINGGQKNIIFATGTPVSNTLCELYVNQYFLQPDTLKKAGIYAFDQWAANFGEVTTELELAVEGNGFRFKSRFSKFINLPELMNLYRQIADVQTKDDIKLNVPDMVGGKPIIVETQPDEFTRLLMEEMTLRAEMIRAGMVDATEDNFLKITHEARLMGTDSRLLYPDAPHASYGKLDMVVENVMYEHHKAETEGKIGCQLVFSDIGTPGAGKAFTVYDYIKNELVKKGIPSEQIAFVHDAKTDVQRDVLFRDVRSGRKRILLGSTDKAGTGVNVQTFLTALHHIDCPWKPSSIEQREGRAIRQGNTNKEVSVYRYVTQRTFDAYNWQIIENKHRFISQVMTNKLTARSCEDIDEAALSYAEIKAIATGDSRIREKMEVDNEIHKLRLLAADYNRNRYRSQDNLTVRYPAQVAAMEKRIEEMKEDIAHRNSNTTDDFEITIGRKVYTERKKAGVVLVDIVNAFRHKYRNSYTKPIEIGSYKGFTLSIGDDDFTHFIRLTISNKGSYSTEVSDDPVGIVTRLNNLCNNLDATLNDRMERLKEVREEMVRLQEEVKKPFEHADRLKELLVRQVQLNEELDVSDENESKDYSSLLTKIQLQKQELIDRAIKAREEGILYVEKECQNPVEVAIPEVSVTTENTETEICFVFGDESYFLLDDFTDGLPDDPFGESVPKKTVRQKRSKKSTSISGQLSFAALLA